MTCAAAETWLLTARSLSELPEPVRAHIDQCRGCSRRLATLTRTDNAVRNLASPPNPPSTVRQRLADAIERTPQTAPQPHTEPRPQRSTRRIPGWVIGLAAAVLVCGGWLIGRTTAPRPVAQIPTPNNPGSTPAPIVPAPVPPPGLPVAPFPSLPAGPVARAARQAGRITVDATPLAQADAFERFAAEIRTDALHRAAVGDVDALARLAGLHDRLLKLGVARQLARVPEAQRVAAGEPIADGLKQAADEVVVAAALLPPLVGELLEALPASCRDTADAIRKGKPPAASSDWPSPPTPLEAVAAQTIRLANVDDPMARADESVRLAAVLAQLVTVLSSAGLSDDAGRVGETIAVVFEHGVAGNLERVETSDLAGKLLGEVTLVRERADRATEVLEQHLAKAPPAAQAGLERAIVASAPGKEKATGKPPGKPPGTGPPWKKGGIPPGLQKKP